MVRAVRPPWAAPPRIAVDGHGKPWSMSDDGDWCFQCGVPTVDRDGADDPCCWNCPGAARIAEKDAPGASAPRWRRLRAPP